MHFPPCPCSEVAEELHTMARSVRQAQRGGCARQVQPEAAGVQPAAAGGSKGGGAPGAVHAGPVQGQQQGKEAATGEGAAQSS